VSRLNRLTENKDAHKRVLTNGTPMSITVLPGVAVNCIVEAEAGSPYRIKFTYEQLTDLMVFTSFRDKFPDR
jgi:hypothetical protein